MTTYKPLFVLNCNEDRPAALNDYWHYLQNRNGNIEEDQQSLQAKSEYYQELLKRPVRANYQITDALNMEELANKLSNEDLRTVDKRLLVLVAIHKFANHEASGIQAAWKSTNSFSDSQAIDDKITRYHLCEEFCHVRLFGEMFKIFGLEPRWVPLSLGERMAYSFFCRFPSLLLSPAAFCSEIMGIMFYRHMRKVLVTVFAYDPPVLERLLELLGEIMVDELGHIGERRSYLTPLRMKMANLLLPVMIRHFYADIPEAMELLNVEEMIKEGLAFDYSGIDDSILERAWIPEYCKA